MKATGRHRSLELAERHARQLTRAHGGTWIITSRRTDDGRFSSHGHNFTFKQEPEEEEEEEEEPEPVEYAVSTTYKGRKSNNVAIQFSIMGPPKATRDQVIEAINAHIDNTELPKGYKVKSMRWKNHRSRNIRRDTNAFAAPLAFSDVRVSRHRRS
jgi:hypothetical protein